MTDLTPIAIAIVGIAFAIVAHNVGLRWLDTIPTAKDLARRIERCEQATMNLAKESADAVARLDSKLTNAAAAQQLSKTRNASPFGR